MTHYGFLCLSKLLFLGAGDWRRATEKRNDWTDVCLNRQRMMKSVITEETRLLGKRYDLFTVHAFSQSFKYQFYVRGTAFSCDFHIVAMSVYIFLLTRVRRKNVYGVHVNRFVYSDDVKFYNIFQSLFGKLDDCFLYLEQAIRELVTFI